MWYPVVEIYRTRSRKSHDVVIEPGRTALVGAWFVAQLLAGFIVGIGTRDAVSFAVAPLVLGGLALLAAWHPVRRALRMDPMTVLRAD